MEVLLERGVVFGRENRGSRPSGVVLGEGNESDMVTWLSFVLLSTQIDEWLDCQDIFQKYRENKKY